MIRKLFASGFYFIQEKRICSLFVDFVLKKQNQKIVQLLNIQKASNYSQTKKWEKARSTTAKNDNQSSTVKIHDCIELFNAKID